MYTHLPYGYYTYRKGVTSFRPAKPPVSAAIGASYMPARFDARVYFACGKSHDASSAITTCNSDYAVLGQIPTCPNCAVLWDELLEKVG